MLHALAFGMAAALGWGPPAPVPDAYAFHAAYAPPARSHAILERSTPANGDMLDAAPPELTLGFSGPIEASGAHVHLLGPEGRAWTLEVRRQPGDPRTLVSVLPDLRPGGYRVTWRVISSDGHPVGGELVFYLRGGGSEPLTEPPASDAGMGSHGGAEQDPHVAAPLIVMRAAANLALLPLAGLLLFVMWGAVSGPGHVTPLTDRTGRLASLAAPVLAGTYAWLWAGETLATGAPRLAGLLSLTTGRALAAETSLALLVPWALLLARRVGLAAVLALLAVGAGALGGHPAAYTPSLSLPASAAHALAAAVWLGGLVFLVTERGSGSYGVSARRVSTTALVCVGVVALTGIVQSWTMLGSLERLASTFGLILAIKAAGFAGLIAFGAYHRLRLVPAAGSPEGATELSRSVRNELALATCVVVLAALLSHIPPTS